MAEHINEDIDNQEPQKEQETNQNLKLMVDYENKSKDLESKGNNPLGFWVGPEAARYNEHNSLKPVFVFSQPAETQIPHRWREEIPDESSENYIRFKNSGLSLGEYQRANIDNPNYLVPFISQDREAFIVQHTYIILTPDGPIGIKFNKRLINEDGTPHERHAGPGGNPILDYDEVEGGEKGTFLPKLYEIFDQDNKDKTWSGTDFTPIGITTEIGTNRLVLKLGSGMMEDAVYSEAVLASDTQTPDTNLTTNRWGIVRNIDEGTISAAIKNSIEHSHRTREKIKSEVDKETNEKKVALVASFLEQV